MLPAASCRLPAQDLPVSGVYHCAYLLKKCEMAVDVSKLVSLKEAQRAVLEQVTPLPIEVVRLEDGSGRVVAEELRASRDEPPATQAAMDGYAVRSADVESASPEESVMLKVVGVVGVGQRSERKLKRGETFRVMTGTTLPEGADAVVPQEMTENISERIRVTAPVAPGDHLLPTGAVVHRDQRLISSGAVLRANELTILAAQGYGTIEVRRQPVVAVLATGSELKEVGASLDGGEVFASNLHTVSQLVHRCGGTARSLGVVADDLKHLTETIRKGYGADVVVTTGGTGKGEKDLVSAAIAALEGDLFFQGVDMSPGKQTLFAMMNKTLLFGLPGRPSASYIAFEQLVRPMLLRMLGLSEIFLPEITATLSNSIQAKGRTLSFLFSRLIFGPDGPEVESLRSKSKGMLTEMLAANSLIKVEPGMTHLEEGARVRVQLLDLGLAGLSYFPES